MVKNMLNTLSTAYADAKILGTIKEFLRDAQGTSDLCQKKTLINRAFKKLQEINDDDNTYILSEIINLSLDIAGNGTILSNNIDRCIGVAIKELRECQTRLDDAIKNV